MNGMCMPPLELHDMPEKIEDFLEWGIATCARFNRHGNLLAVGTTRGQIVLWDFDTKQVASVLGIPHEQPMITSVSFPAARTGSTVLATHSNGLVRVWDVLAKAVLIDLHLNDAPHIIAEPHPRTPYLVLLLPQSARHSCAPAFVQLCAGSYSGSLACCVLTALDDASVPPADHDGARRIRAKLGELPTPPPVPGRQKALRCVQLEAQEGHAPFVARFTRAGDSVLVGAADGSLRAFGFDGVKWCTDCRGANIVPGRAPIRDIVMARRTDTVVVVSADRTLRMYAAPVLFHPTGNAVAAEPLQIFRDVVNSVQWRCAALSRGGEFVLGGMGGAEHRVAVWRTADGQLEKTLDGPREPIGGLLWHPVRPVLVSLGGLSGGLYVWERNVSANWSAFAPDFVELEANEEYVEREDEFDLPDDDDARRSHDAREQSEKEAVVDILANDRDPNFDEGSDGAPDACFFYVPPDPHHPYQCPPSSPPPRQQTALQTNGAPLY